MLGAVFLGLLFVEQCEEFVEGQLVESLVYLSVDRYLIVGRSEGKFLEFGSRKPQCEEARV